jgi:hypothetical protein
MNVIRAGLLTCLLLALRTDAAAMRLTLLPDRTRTTLDQPIRVTLTVVTDKNLGQLQAPEVPASEDFTVLRVDRSRSSFSTSSVIGQASTVENTYYFYYLVSPKRLGTFTFPALTLTADGATQTTRPFTVEVVDKPVSTPDVIARLRVGKTRLYVGEQTVLAVTVGHKPNASVQLTSEGFRALLDGINESASSMFSLTDLTRGKIAGVEEIMEGERYVVYRAEFSLAPIASGSKTLGPSPLQYNVLTRSQRRGRDPFDDFFGGSFFGGGVTATPATVMSNSLSISAMALPPAPSDFCGAVGSVTLSADIAPRELPAGEAATLKISLRAPVRPGSLGELALPKIKDAEVFTPEKQTIADTSRGGISTRRTYKYLVIPRSEGSLEIPAITTSWFDPGSGSYRSSSAGPFTLEVSKGSVTAEGKRRYMTQEEIREVGQDIRFIKTPVQLRPRSRYPHRSPVLFLVNLLPFFVVISAVLYRLQAERRARDPSLGLRKGAYRNALHALHVLHKSAPSTDVLGGVTSAVENYLTHRFRFPATGMTTEERDGALREAQVNAEVRSELGEVFSRLDSARFGGSTLQGDARASLIAATRSVVVKLEESARKVKR